MFEWISKQGSNNFDAKTKTGLGYNLDNKNYTFCYSFLKTLFEKRLIKLKKKYKKTIEEVHF